MKKTKLFSTLALASCVMLPGCNFGSGNLSVSELPHLVAGEAFDLTSYVTKKGKGAFTVSLSEESKKFVSVDESGTKITASHSGDIEFTVSYKKKSVECKAVVDSKEYVEYAKVATDSLYDYMLGQYELNAAGDGYSFSYYEVFNKKYYITITPPQTAVGSYEIVGMTEIGGKVYSFIPGYDESGKGVVEKFVLNGDEPASLASYCIAYPLVASKGVSKYVPAEGEAEAYECISITDAKTVESAVGFIFGLDVSALKKIGYNPVEIQVIPVEEELEDGTKITCYENSLFVEVKNDPDVEDGVYAFWFTDSYFGEAAVAFPELEKSFPTTAPHDQSEASDFEVLESILACEKYVIGVQGGWYDFYTGSPVPESSNPFLDDATRAAAGIDDYEIGDLLIDYLNAYYNPSDVSSGAAYAFITPDQTLAVHDLGSASNARGLVEDGGKLYSYTRNDDGTKYVRSEIGSGQISDAKQNAYSYQFLEGFANAFYNNRSSEGNDVTLEFAYATALEVMEKLFVNAFPKLITVNENIQDPEAYVMQYADIGNMIHLMNEYGMFDDCQCALTINTSTKDVSLSIVYDTGSAITVGSTGHYYVYMISASIAAVDVFADISSATTAIYGEDLGLEFIDA